MSRIDLPERPPGVSGVGIAKELLPHHRLGGHETSGQPKQPAAFDVARRQLCLERRTGLFGAPALDGRVARHAREDDQARRACHERPAISLQRLSDDVPSRVRGRGYRMPGEEPPEIAGQIRRRRVPPIAFLRQCAADDRLEVSVQRRVERTQPRRLVFDDAARKFGKRRRVAAEGKRVGEQSEQEDAERVDVRACVDPARTRQSLARGS